MLVDVQDESWYRSAQQFVPDCGRPKAEHPPPVDKRDRTVRQKIDALAGEPPLTTKWIGCREPHKQLTTVRGRRFGNRCVRGTWAGHTGLYKSWISAFALNQDFLKVLDASSERALNPTSYLS